MDSKQTFNYLPLHKYKIDVTYTFRLPIIYVQRFKTNLRRIQIHKVIFRRINNILDYFYSSRKMFKTKNKKVVHKI